MPPTQVIGAVYKTPLILSAHDALCSCTACQSNDEPLADIGFNFAHIFFKESETSKLTSSFEDVETRLRALVIALSRARGAVDGAIVHVGNQTSPLRHMGDTWDEYETQKKGVEAHVREFTRLSVDEQTEAIAKTMAVDEAQNSEVSTADMDKCRVRMLAAVDAYADLREVNDGVNERHQCFLKSINSALSARRNELAAFQRQFASNA